MIHSPPSSLRILLIISQIDSHGFMHKHKLIELRKKIGGSQNLKYGDKARAIEIAEANNNYQQANRLRKQLIKIQDLESEISMQIQFP